MVALIEYENFFITKYMEKKYQNIVKNGQPFQPSLLENREMYEMNSRKFSLFFKQFWALLSWQYEFWALFVGNVSNGFFSADCYPQFSENCENPMTFK